MTQLKIEYHEVPVTGKLIMKAFARGDFVFLDLQGRQIFCVKHHRESICKLKVTWRTSKRIAEMDKASLGNST